MKLHPCIHILALLLYFTFSHPASQAADIVAQWEFGAEEETPLLAHGGVHRDVPGPRPPTFPDFDAGNTAVKFDGKGAHFSFADTGPNSPFDFTNGDPLTIEGWVKLDDMREGENLYIICKGRTGAAGFARDNQNWALRLRGVKGKACVSFLFATPPVAGVAKTDAHWHRWTTTTGFPPQSGWHHIAVTYRFGEPESVTGWIDGKSLEGAWDMGGSTKEKPVVDDDAVWLGSSQAGNPGNSFRGSLDSVTIHRAILDDKTLAARFRRVGKDPDVVQPTPETMPNLGELPRGRVLATFHEGMPSHDRWLQGDEIYPKETARWLGDEMLLPRLPHRYDEWGIRDSWNAPVLVRLAADVSLPPGRHRLLLRTRGLSRLWVDGAIVARTKPHQGSPSGEELITPVAEPPLPELRPAEHRAQEVFAEIEVGNSGTSRIVLEAMAGGKKFRAETGELCLAVQTSDGKSYTLVQPSFASSPAVPLTDTAVDAALNRIEASLTSLDNHTRHTAAASRDDFWKKRHQTAQEWVKQHPAPAVPNIKEAKHPVDAFLADKIQQAVAAAAKTPVQEAQHFHSTVLPILRENCFRCHGEKDQGGLRLNSREAALKGGESEVPAVVPGKTEDSELIARIKETDESLRMPPTGTGLKPDQIAVLEKWIASGAAWPAAPLTPDQITSPPLVDDSTFLRRLYLDTVGLSPTEAEVRAFLADKSPNKRQAQIDLMLADERWADHWMGYWQDLLAENPTLINATLNSTGPFRWFLYEALRDDKPLDRLITELVMLRGSQYEGGSAGFGMAAQNDAPFAAKGHIVASAFLGLELQCARCHDSPYHSTKQRDLYALAAMFERKSVTVPKTSMVPVAFFEKKAREALIQVTLKPGESVAPVWPFAAVTGVEDDESLTPLVENPKDTRERLAALLTAPQNTRFAQVVVNRIWQRLLGVGFVEPVHDWEGHLPSHPALLDWLARELVAHDYNIKHVARLILTSQTYQRAAVGQNRTAPAEQRFFNAPERRRMTAEQIVDSFFAASGQPLEVEDLTLDPDGRRPASNRARLGEARRAWMLVNLSNERDRPSLTLPRAAAVAEVLEIFGWSAARQTPRTERETSPNVLQPGALANSSLSLWLTRAAYRSPLADLAVEADSPEALIDSIFLRFLGRFPTAAERQPFLEPLTEGFAQRLVPAAEIQPPAPPERLPQVTWSNHLRSEANLIQQEWERRVRVGPPADPRLRSEWREIYEDLVWSVVNTPEFVWMP